MADQEKEQYYLNTIAELTATVTKLSASLAQMTLELEKSNAANAELQKKIEELTLALLAKKVRKNSRNSSVPPSMDGYNKPAPKSLREKSGKTQGGQKGHTGHGMEITRELDEEKHHYPTGCTACPNFGSCEFHCVSTNYETEIEITTKLIAHKQMSCVCPLQKTTVSGVLPKGIRGTKQFGNKLKAFVAMLLTTGYVSVDRVHQILKGLGIQMSTGTIQNILHNAAQNIVPAADRIKAIISGQKVIHADETGCRVNGKLSWIHCLCDPSWSYCAVHEKRGSAAMDEIGVIPALADCVLVHDFWAPYLKYGNIQHSFCNTHLARELIYAFDVTGQNWADNLNKLLSEMCGLRNAYKEQGKTEFSEAVINDFSSRYDLYVSEGLALNPIVSTEKRRGRKAKGKTRSLLERLQTYKTDILRFLTDWSIPFTNNEAERCVRFAKVKGKVSGGFRSEDGAHDFLSLASYLGSARKHGVLSYDALVSAFEGTALTLVESWHHSALA